MTPRRDDSDLLDDVLAETMPPDYREELFASTLTSVRRRRRARGAARAGTALAAIALLAWIGWRSSVSTAGRIAQSQPAYRVVSTEPLPANAIVQTLPLDARQVVVSSPFSASVRTLRGITRLIDDRELLALAGQYSAVLVRVGPEEQRLVMPHAQVGGAAPQ